PLPLPAGCKQVGIHVDSDTSVFVAAACPDDAEARVFRFDGRVVTPIPTPSKAPATALTGEAGGTLWLAHRDPPASAVLRPPPAARAGSRAPLPTEPVARGDERPFETRFLVVRGDDVWAIAALALHAPRRAFDAQPAAP